MTSIERFHEELQNLAGRIVAIAESAQCDDGGCRLVTMDGRALANLQEVANQIYAASVIEQDRYKYFPTEALDRQLAVINQHAAARKDKWRGENNVFHLTHHEGHMVAYKQGDNHEPHLINGSLRLMMAQEVLSEP